MSKDKVKTEEKANKDTLTWQSLIDAAEREIEAGEKRVKDLRASVRFFKRKLESGETVPQLPHHATR